MHQNDLAKRINWHHAAMQGTYSGSSNAIWCFVSVILLYFGFANTQIGVITALAAMLPVLIAPRLSALADSNPRFTARRFAMMLVVLMEVAGIVALCFLKNHAVMAVSFLLIGICITSIPSYINAMISECVQCGINVNYGMGRGFGSLVYALVSLLVGLLVDRYSPAMLIPLFLVLNVLAFVSVATFRYTLPPLPPERAAAQPISNRALLKKYPSFALLIIGWALLFGSHSASNLYLIHVVRRLGEDEQFLTTLIAVCVFLEFPSMYIFRSLVRKKPLRFWFCVSAAGFILRHVVLLFATSPLQLYIIAIAQFFEIGMLVPASTMYVMEYLDAANQVKGQTLLYSVSNGVGPACVSLLGGRMLDVYGIDAMLTMVLGCSVLGMLIVVAALFILPKYKMRRDQSEVSVP